MDNDFPPPQEPKASGSFLKNCLIGCFVMFLIMLVVGGGAIWWVTKNANRLMADFGTKAIDSIVDSSQLPVEDKAAIKAEVGRVATALREDRIGQQDLLRGLQELTESPAVTLIVVAGVRETYLKKSGLDPAEKEAGERAIQRVARGVINKDISQEQVQELLKLIGTADASGNVQLKQQLTDEELRTFLAEAKRVADEANVPDEEFEVNVVEEVRKVVDRILNEAGATEPNDSGDAPVLPDGSAEIETEPANESY
jgi:hypothetical protein